MNSVCEDRNAKFKFLDVVDPSSFCLSLWNSGFAWKCQNYLIAVIQTDATNVQCIYKREYAKNVYMCLWLFLIDFDLHWTSAIIDVFFFLPLKFRVMYFLSGWSVFFFVSFSVFSFLLYYMCYCDPTEWYISLSFGDGNQTRFKWNMYDHNNFRKFETQPIEQTKIYYNGTWE